MFKLLVIFGVANPAQEERIPSDYLHHGVGIAEPYPVRVLHLIIHPGNKDRREYYRNNPEHAGAVNGGTRPLCRRFTRRRWSKA